ncbi:hypothetical protein EVAR_59900_1 [Eumeta japonica]|uniref:Uncharacterized protein n=1 Tax=Eumeta variegata TaxID=151549 RepID=A0A4C2AHG0_EUMVA|nr:hypothetical protein EVAR_59900_1 [Eumeta japonica]
MRNSIPPRNSKRRLKLPWSPELEEKAMRAQRSGASETRPQQAGVRGRGEPVGRHLQGHQGNGKNREDILLQTDSGLVLSPNESATLLAETFFLMTGRSSASRGSQKANRRDDRPPATSGSARWTHLTGLRLKRPAHPQRPGIDGFTSDICQAAIFRDLGVFLAMANKCLELGYFPGRRPAPVLGKTVERMLVGASNGTLMPKLQATQYGFMPQRGTEDALMI